MYTKLNPVFSDDSETKDAVEIIKACVHCGFCNATCPTYQELGDERDGPRGRIYLIKQFLEEGAATSNTVRHLDRCLTCRACETTCPSGVEYGKLVDIGRNAIERKVPRPLPKKLVRALLLHVLPFKQRFAVLLRIGQFFKPLLPKFLAQEIPDRQAPLARPLLAGPNGEHPRTMLVLGGCAQAAATPNTNIAAARVFDRLGIALLEPEGSGCCGAASFHLAATDQARDFARRNIDAWWPAIEQGAEKLLITASGCGTMVKDYADLLKNDPDYASKARTVSTLTVDLSEAVAAEDISGLTVKPTTQKIAPHCPCSLYHGQQLPSAVEHVLARLNIRPRKTKDKHLCCGSAGTYSLLQPKMSRTLRANKLEALGIDGVDQIVTANVGCQMHLASGADVPVRHWIELMDELTAD